MNIRLHFFFFFFIYGHSNLLKLLDWFKFAKPCTDSSLKRTIRLYRLELNLNRNSKMRKESIGQKARTDYMQDARSYGNIAPSPINRL